MLDDGSARVRYQAPLHQEQHKAEKPPRRTGHEKPAFRERRFTQIPDLAGGGPWRRASFDPDQVMAIPSSPQISPGWPAA
jgi:hypothetical protein